MMRTPLGLVFFYLCALVSGSASAQDLPQFSVLGSVFDARTGEPLPNVNLYLSNTTRGTTTSLQGEFVIRNVPAGLYELVCSMVGYERQTIRLRLFEKQNRPITIRLNEVAIRTETVEVIGRDPKEWREHLGRFISYFFGKTENATECTLENPEVLEFTTDKKTGRFEATAKAPLRIMNRALGYRVEFMLQLFQIDGALFRYGGSVLFVPMEAEREGEEDGWNKNRERTFRGSLRHFLISLINNRLTEEGFRIAKMHQIPSTGSARVPREVVNPPDILSVGQFEFERSMAFDHFLMVEYVKEAPEDGFREFWRGQAGWQQSSSGRHQVSWIKLDFIDVRMNLTGNLYDPFSLKTYGYWSFERVGEWLPLEYLPGASP